MTDELVCCGLIEQVADKYDMPFGRPMGINFKTGGWSLRLFNLTKRGNMSSKGTGWLLLSYCPICGKRIAPEEADR
jgi:hypothetical protein